MDEATTQYLEAIQKMADTTNVISGLTDEQVWLQFAIAMHNSPVELLEALNDNNVSLFEYADSGLEEFKKRFRGA